MLSLLEDNDIETIILTFIILFALTLISRRWFFKPPDVNNRQQQRDVMIRNNNNNPNYPVVHNPYQPTPTPPPPQHHHRRVVTQDAVVVNRVQGGGGGVGGGVETEGFGATLTSNTRVPPHASIIFANNPFQIQHEGIIPFRHTLASTYESSNSNSNSSQQQDHVSSSRQMTNRKERAKIFTRLFSSSRIENSHNGNVSNTTSTTGNGNGNGNAGKPVVIVTPPSRGSNMVVTIPQQEIGYDDNKLRRVLYLLGSYYNLFVLISLSKKNKDDNNDNDNEEQGRRKTETEEYKHNKLIMKEIEKKLRGTTTTTTTTNTTNQAEQGMASSSSDKEEEEEDTKHTVVLPVDILPSHRIIGVSSITGRVAFIRQLPKKPDIVLDYEVEIRNQLTRFGFTVLLYKATFNRNDDDDDDGGVGGGGSMSSGIGEELLG